MNIGLYQEPTNSELTKYRGLYRQNSIFELMESDAHNLIDWFFSLSREGDFIEYSEDNKERLSELYSILRTQKWKGEILLFTDCYQERIPSDFVLLGYDICADSKYYSPIGDGFLQSYDKDNSFFRDMSIAEFDLYKSNINDAGLFDTYSVAVNFAKYCNEINNKYEHSVESENNWRPFFIYKMQ